MLSQLWDKVCIWV